MQPNKMNLLKLLSNQQVTFFIPPYQRNYEWTEEQCEVFWADIIKTYEMNKSGKNSEHFFGTITYFQNDAVFGQPSKLVLIDGQQRLTTTMLFLVALRDFFGDGQLGQYIDSNFLRNDKANGSSEYKIKLKQVETDWTAYKNIILKNDLTDSDKQTAVYRNYRFFLDRFEGCKEKDDIAAFVEKGLDKFSVIAIELEPDKNPWENPQEIFESMNSLGKPLSLADLVRNYLLLGLNAEKQDNWYNNYWLQIEKTLAGQISNFIRDYMQAKEAKSFYKASESNHKKLYGLFKTIFQDSEAEELLKDLAECSVIYSYCIGKNPTDSEKMNRKLSDLNRLGTTTAYSFLMCLLREWKHGNLSEQDTFDILDAFTIYCMRRRLIQQTQAENKNFPSYVTWLPDLIRAENKKARMFELLANQENSSRLPNDVEVSNFMNTMNFYNFKHCKFFLALIEESITKVLPDLSHPNLQIEHIMPQKLNDEWKAELGPNWEEIHQELVNSVGNLTLIYHNQELGNKSFSEKKVIYNAKAAMKIAHLCITDREKWDESAIRGRGKWVIDYLLKNIFPIPDAMRKANNFHAKSTGGLSFEKLQLIGMEISFYDDPTITARVVSDNEVEFEGKKWLMSPLTRVIQTRRGKANSSGAYQGAQYWAYDGVKLADLM